MKYLLRIWMMLLLLVMIVSQGSSQVVYIINDIRYSCYDDYENREIAKLILEGEYCDELKLNYKDQIIQLEEVNKALYDLNEYRAFALDSIIIGFRECEQLVRRADKHIIKLEDDMNKKNKYLIVSVTINVVLMLILII